VEFADELNAKALPIPSEQRADVFVATPDSRLEESWLLAGGKSTFHLRPTVQPEAAAKFCGVALFVLENPNRVPDYVYLALRPFFDRAGTESNVFEYCPIQKNFTRRDRSWLFSRVYSTVTGCPAPDR